MARLAKARYMREFKVHAVSMARDEGLGIEETAIRQNHRQLGEAGPRGPIFHEAERSWPR